jgi:uncharacterized protein YecE (DUF72 family)
MLLRVGKPKLQGDLGRYARDFDLVELRAEPGTLPRAVRLREMRAQAPDGFVWSVVLSRAVGTLVGGEETRRGVEAARKAVEALGAAWLVLQTPPTVTPNARTRRLLAALAAELPRDSVRVAWEPAGIWEAKAAAAVAGELGMHLVCDPTRVDPPPDAVVYVRLRALGVATRLGGLALERLVDHLADREAAYVVLESTNAARAARLLRAALSDGALAARESALDDDDDADADLEDDDADDDDDAEPEDADDADDDAEPEDADDADDDAESEDADDADEEEDTDDEA